MVHKRQAAMDEVLKAVNSVPTRVDIAVTGDAVRSVLLSTWGTPTRLPGVWSHRTASALLWDTPLDAKAFMFPTGSIRHTIVIVQNGNGNGSGGSEESRERAMRLARQLSDDVTVLNVVVSSTRSLARATEEVTRICTQVHGTLVRNAEVQIANALSAANLKDTAVGVGLDGAL